MAETDKCADCTFSFQWPFYQPPILVCQNPKVLLQTGGPRSCQDICRRQGPCGFAGALFEARKAHRPDAPDKTAPAASGEAKKA